MKNSLLLILTNLIVFICFGQANNKDGENTENKE